MNNLLPHSARAEQSVIAATLLDSKSYYNAASILGYADFYEERHKIIFYAMEKMFASNGDQVDVVNLSDFLAQKGKLEEVGGTEYLLTLLDSLPTAANIKADATVVKEKSAIRKIITFGETLKLSALDGGRDVKSLIDKASADLFQIINESSGYDVKKDVLTPQAHASKLIDTVYTAMETPGNLRGIAVGFSTLDFISKGLRELTLIAADSGRGKTALSLNWAVNLGVKKQIPCLYINCEMGVEDLGYRILSIVSGIEEDVLTLGKGKAFIKQIDSSIKQISDSGLFITGNMPKTINNIIAMIYQHKIQHGIKVVFIDYLGEIEPDELAYKEKSEYLTYGRWAQMTKDACAKLDIKPVIVHQLNREGKIAGSLKLERKAALFCTLEEDKNGEIYLKVRKNRGGKCPVNIAIEFNKPTLTIKDEGYYL